MSDWAHNFHLTRTQLCLNVPYSGENYYLFPSQSLGDGWLGEGLYLLRNREIETISSTGHVSIEASQRLVFILHFSQIKDQQNRYWIFFVRTWLLVKSKCKFTIPTMSIEQKSIHITSTRHHCESERVKENRGKNKWKKEEMREKNGRNCSFQLLIA